MELSSLSSLVAIQTEILNWIVQSVDEEYEIIGKRESFWNTSIKIFPFKIYIDKNKKE